MTVRAFPQHPSNPPGKKYGRYCKHQLIKYQPWQGQPSKAWGGGGDKDSTCIQAYHSFLSTPEAETQIPLFAQEFDQAQQHLAENYRIWHGEWQQEATHAEGHDEWMLLCCLSPCNSSRLMALQLDSLVDTSKLEDLFASVLCMSIISSFDHHVLAFISEFVIATASLQLWNSASLCWSFVSKPNSKLSLPVRNLPIKVLFRPDALDFIDDTDASTAWIFANGDSGSTAVMSLNSWYDCFLLLAISHMQKAAQSSENTLLAANADVKCDYALL